MADTAENIRDEVLKNIRWLMRSLSPSRSPIDKNLEAEAMVHVRPFISKRNIAERIIRIEVDRDTEVDLLEWLFRQTYNPYQYANQVGPKSFIGVDLYVVDRLPAPGWHVVNPFMDTGDEG